MNQQHQHHLVKNATPRSHSWPTGSKYVFLTNKLYTHESVRKGLQSGVHN